MTKEKSTPAPLETEPGKQMDDNIDDLGRKGGQGKLDQPINPEKRKDVEKGE